MTGLGELGTGRRVCKGAPSHAHMCIFLNKGTQTDVHHQDSAGGTNSRNVHIMEFFKAASKR